MHPFSDEKNFDITHDDMVAVICILDSWHAKIHQGQVPTPNYFWLEFPEQIKTQSFDY